MSNIASALVLNYYGKIKGTADVSGPIFYASSEGNFPLYKLSVNTPPSTSYQQEISFTDGSTIWFKTDSLGINTFYPATYKFYVKAKASPANYKMFLDFEIVHSDGSFTSICNTEIAIDSTDYKVYPASCNGAQQTLTSTDSFACKIIGAVATVNYYVLPDGSTIIEVS
ncbi:MAG: hypothetical protein ACTSR2_02155 [Candidatus Hodarchaeales archaeon]